MESRHSLPRKLLSCSAASPRASDTGDGEFDGGSLATRPLATLVFLGAAALMVAGASAQGLQFVPPAGYSGGNSVARKGVATPPEPGAPALSRIPDSQLSSLFKVNRTYRRAGKNSRLWRTSGATAKVVGAFAIAEPPGMHFVDAWALGFLPVTLSFSDGRCFSMSADYVNGTLSNGRLNRVSCEGRRTVDGPPPPKPADQSLRLLGSAWGYGAWTDPKTSITIVAAPFQTKFEPLFTARMKATAMMAMNSPDAPFGNVTLVGKINGRLSVVTLEVGY